MLNTCTSRNSFLFTLLVFFFGGNHLIAQTEKPALDFDIQINSIENKLEVTWFSCLENSIITLMDNSERPLKVQALCKDNGNIDISDLGNDVYYVKVEHYTGEGIKSVVKNYASNETEKTTLLETNIKSNLEFQAYPNPAQSLITVELEDCLEGSQVSLVDIHGKILQHQIMSNNQDMIDISTLAKGVYFIRIEHAKGVGIQRIVKN